MLELPRTLTDEEISSREEKYTEIMKDFDRRLNAAKRDIIKRLYLNPADTTYLTARWQFLNGMPYEYYWSALHSIEKYLKAILLYNGFSATNINHDILKAYDLVESFVDSDLLPRKFPEILTNRISHLTSISTLHRLRFSGPREYVECLQSVGGADARYAMTSETHFTTDLYCLDLTVFLIRRLADDLRKKSVSDAIKLNPDQCSCKNAFLEEVFTREQHSLKEVAEKVNYFLCPEPDTSKYRRVSGFGGGFSNSALYNNIVENKESNDEMRVKISEGVADWMLENVPCSKKTKREIKENFASSNND